jgi:two-component system chemotaxis response regulator CheB
VIQDPLDAQVASMPRSALIEAGADFVVPAREIGSLLARLARTPLHLESGAAANEHDVVGRVSDVRVQDLEREVAIGALDEDAHRQPERYGEPSRFACPECGGVLWDTHRGNGPMHFRCETGHAYSPEWLAELQTESVENALWAALRALEDKAELARQRAARAGQHSVPELRRSFETQHEAAQQYAGVVRSLLRLDGRSGMLREEPDATPDDRTLSGEREVARAVERSESQEERESPRRPAERRRLDA